jgi:hypothetical protein
VWHLSSSGPPSFDWLDDLLTCTLDPLLRCLKRVAELFVLRSGEILQPGPGRVQKTAVDSGSKTMPDLRPRDPTSVRSPPGRQPNVMASKRELRGADCRRATEPSEADAVLTHLGHHARLE